MVQHCGCTLPGQISSQPRSVPVDFAVVNEIQSTNVEAIPVLEEALSKSKFGKYRYIGTGSMIGDSWWNLWHKGNQQEWDDSKKTWLATKFHLV